MPSHNLIYSLAVYWIPFILQLALLPGCCRGGSSSRGCTKDTDCRRDRICESGVCVSSPQPVSPGATPAPQRTETPPGVLRIPGRKDSKSFSCGATRCQAGQRCCPGAARSCVSFEDSCDLGSETTIGYLCSPSTNEPCAPGTRCISGKVGASPLTMTAECR